MPRETGPGHLPPGSAVQGPPWGVGPSNSRCPGLPQPCLPITLRDEHHAQGRGTSVGPGTDASSVPPARLPPEPGSGAQRQ